MESPVYSKDEIEMLVMIVLMFITLVCSYLGLRCIDIFRKYKDIPYLIIAILLAVNIISVIIFIKIS
jgi:hypothetical protein